MDGANPIPKQKVWKQRQRKAEEQRQGRRSDYVAIEFWGEEQNGIVTHLEISRYGESCYR